jgi:adenosylcobinamide-phosphate synthase
MMMADHAALLPAILMLEAAIGYPVRLYAAIGHPVTWMGALITLCDRYWNRGSSVRRRIAGAAALLMVGIASAGLAWLIETAARRWLADGWAAIAIMVIATSGLAQRSLYDHVRAVLIPLEHDDMDAARGAVAAIVGRDVHALGEQGIALAATESLAESFCDGIIAPALWFMVGGLPALALFKAVNTADSMVGHRDERYADFGWAAARADDVMNFGAARLAGVMIAIAAWGGLRTMLRDASGHTSPNGGWPEAAMAGALGRQLGGPVSYDGEVACRAVLGSGPLPDTSDLARALGVYRRGCVIMWVFAGVVAWLL